MATKHNIQVAKLAFIGCGNFATVIIQGIIRAGYRPKNIWATRRNLAPLEGLRQQGVNIVSDNIEAIEAADYVFLCPRPQQIIKLFNANLEFYRYLDKPVVSVMAGVDLSILQRFLPRAAIIRSMPNLATQLGNGMTALYANARTSATACSELSSIFSLIGKFIWLEREEMLHGFTAVSGSGIGYFYFLMQLMEQAARDAGFNEQDASKIITQTALGAIMLIEEGSYTSGDALAEIQLPGGTTEAAINAMKFHQIDGSMLIAIRAAVERSSQIAVELRAQLSQEGKPQE